MILGHLGECIPFNIWRIDNIVAKAPRGIPCKRALGEYFRENVSVNNKRKFPHAIPAFDHAGGWQRPYLVRRRLSIRKL